MSSTAALERGEARDLQVPSRASARSLLGMVLIALALRLFFSALLYSRFLDPARNHWLFGDEAGQIATSIYTGHGFSSPFFVPTGPTAWLPPIYPYLMVACMKLFGGYTAASAFAILACNSLFAALTVIPVYFLARHLFAGRTARVAAWTWVLFPYSIDCSAERFWSDTLTCLAATFLWWQTLRLEKSREFSDWLLWGALAGVAAVISPVLLGPLPFLGLWLMFRRRRTGRSWFWPPLFSALVVVVLITPWTVRNYRAFHRFIPMKDNFWEEVHRGNNADTSDPAPDSTAPPHCPAEYDQWVKLGEMGYLDAKKAESLAFIRQHPAFCTWLTIHKVIFTWTGFWSLDPKFLADEPFHTPNVFFTTAMTLLTLLGLRYAWRNGHGEAAFPLVLLLLTFPVVFYLTHPSMDYRHPLDPVLVILCCYGVVEWSRARAARKAAL